MRSSEKTHGTNDISPLKIALFTGGIDKHYASGLSQSLVAIGIAVDMICNAEMIDSEMQKAANLRLLPLYETSHGQRNKFRKLLAVLLVYARLIGYAAKSSAPVFHILWNYKIALLDRTILLVYYKLLGKELVFTAHNVNAGERDGTDSLLNRTSLRIQYRLVNHIFVHTEKMRDQLVQDFGVREEKVTVIPFGTYDVVPQTTLTPAEARERLGLKKSERVILFFGRIVPYKGLDSLVDAFMRIASKDESYRLVIAGAPMKEGEEQWRQVQRRIEQSSARNQVLQHTRFIEDKEIETYFKGADVLALPYTQIFQSGVLFMSYSFGLPVVATDVGSFGDDVVAGVTGFVCRPGDPADLASALEKYFSSELFRALDEKRVDIKSSIRSSHSWEIAAVKTGDVYAQLSEYKELRYST